MSAHTQLSLEEYLRTSYEPDAEYLDGEIVEKLEEYRAWAAPHVWLIDPWVRKLYVYTAGLSEVAAFQVPEYNLELPAAEIFS